MTTEPLFPSSLEMRLWRTGRKVGRTIYACVGDSTRNDVLIGMMDTPALANCTVDVHNAWVRIGFANKETEQA